MKPRALVLAGLATAAAWSFQVARAADPPPLSVQKLTSRQVDPPPPGPLYWRLENFADLASARSAAGPWSLVAQADGKVWLFSLGPASDAWHGGTKVAELGPVPAVAAQHVLLQINEASGPPGSVTPVHTHPGSEAYYVISGETICRTPTGDLRVGSGRAAAGHETDTPMQVSSSGSTDLHSLVMFVVDADRPFSTPARWP